MNGVGITSRLLKLTSLLIISLVFLSSCSVPKTTSYFKKLDKDTILTMPNVVNEDLKIKKGDVLSLSISSLNKMEDEFFNSKSSNGNSVLSGYQVGNDGEIYLHKIGKLVVAGLTRKQLKNKLEEELKPYLKDAIVVVNFDNHHITVIGEVGKPQLFPMPEERISIIDLLAQSGPVNPAAELSNVIVIRESESGDKKEVRHINLEDHSIFTSPYYYLQPNDIIVLGPDEKILLREKKSQKNQQIYSIVLQLITTGLVIYQIFRR